MRRDWMITSLVLCMAFNVSDIFLSSTAANILRGFCFAWAAMAMADWIHS